MNRIAVINASTVLTDAQIKPMVAAVEIQIDRDFYPMWGKPGNLKFVPKGTAPPKGYWQMAILDDADQAGALGYHDETIEGLPIGKVFAKTTLQYGEKVSVTLSHEILEMLADPDVNLLMQDAVRARRFWAYEDCDAVEGDDYPITVLSGSVVPVSNFVLPAYFETFRTSGPFDFLKKLTKPVPAMTPGGYMAYVDGTGWHQVFAAKARAAKTGAAAQFRARPREGGRRHRRMLGRENWIRSTVKVG
jgi:hypothetical protein